MLIWENILLALAGLKANKMRSLLTMLGIIIGIASVIIIIILGDSVTNSFSNLLQEEGANSLEAQVMPKNTKSLYTYDYEVREMTEKDYISKEMIEKFVKTYKDDIQGIMFFEAVYGESMDGKGTVTRDHVESKVNIRGYSADYFKIYAGKTPMLEGRGFIKRDFKEGRKVCLVSDKLVDRVFRGDRKKALGSEIEANMGGRYYKYHIVGIYEYKNDTMGIGGGLVDPDNPVTEIKIPYETARIENHAQNQGINYFNLVVAPGTNSAEFADTIRDYFNVNFYSKNDAYNLMVMSLASMVEQFTEMLDMVKMAFIGVAVISLVVGGIGVMNIMLVSITERTKEIGTRKALGATNNSIRLQFITEAIVICFLGGAIGIFVGMGVGNIALKFLNFEPYIRYKAIVAAVLVSVGTGVFFGYSPANKAAKLNPIDALRYE